MLWEPAARAATRLGRRPKWLRHGDKQDVNLPSPQDRVRVAKWIDIRDRLLVERRSTVLVYQEASRRRAANRRRGGAPVGGFEARRGVAKR